MKPVILSHAEKYADDFKYIDASTKQQASKSLKKLQLLHKKYINDKEGLQHLKLVLETLINELRVNGMPEEEKQYLKFLKEIN